MNSILYETLIFELLVEDAGEGEREERRGKGGKQTGTICRMVVHHNFKAYWPLVC
jgi:hypothetical protein